MPRPSKAHADTAHLRANLGAWYLASHPSYRWVDYQQNIFGRTLQDLAARRTKKQRIAFVVGSGHAKSDWGTRTFVPWYLGNHPGHLAMTLSYNEELANGFGKNIRETLEEPFTLSVWPGLKLTSTSVSEMHTQQRNAYFSTGFSGTISGRRLHFLGIDDPVKSLVEARSRAEMLGRFDIYRSVAEHRMAAGGIMAMFLTRYCLNDFYDRVMQYEGEEWEQIILDAVTHTDEDGTEHYLWEDHFGRAKYEKLKDKDPAMWWAMYRGRPAEATGNTFDQSWWLTYKKDEVQPGWATYLVCDPALAEHAQADRTAMWVVAAGPGGKLYVVDGVYDRLDPDKRAQALVRLVRRWNPKRAVYEVKGLNSDLWYINKEFKARNIPNRIIPVGKTGARAMQPQASRILELVADFREGRIWWPEKILQKCANGEVVDIVTLFKQEEFDMYRGADSIIHDDGLDALSRLHDPELNPVYYPVSSPATGPVRRQAQPSWEVVY